MTGPVELWVYLSASPLLWLTLTLAVWVAARALSARLNNHPLANPVLVSVATMAAVLLATGTRYERFFEGAQFVHFLLGPATVALAVQLVRQWAEVRRYAIPALVTLFVGSLVAVSSTIMLSKILRLGQTTVASLAPKSTTAGVAMAISSSIGGDPALTAALVIATGLLGALMVTPLMNAMGIRNYAARGFAVGLASHGIGTARAFTVDPVAGLFAGMAMALNAIVTSVIVPLLI